MINKSTTYQFELPDNSEKASQWPMNRNFEKLDSTILPTLALKDNLNKTDVKVLNLDLAIDGIQKNYVQSNTFTAYQNSITAQFTNYYNKTQVDTKLEDYVLSSTLKDYVTENDLTTILNSYVKTDNNDYVKNNDLTNYATTQALQDLEARVKALEDAATV